MDHETTLSAPQVGSLASAVDQSGPLAFADVLTMGADVAEDLSGRTTGHGGVQPQSLERRASGAWLLAAPGLALDPAAARAPELAADDTPTPAGDVYALGATLVFALTGQAFDDAGFGGDAGDAEAGAEPGDDADSSNPDDPVEPGTAAAGGGGAGLVPQSLPDVMAMFLDTLRRTLSIDPGSRISAGELAGTLRQLRNDADRVTNPVAPTSAMSGFAVGAVGGVGAAAAGGADPAFAAGLLAVDGVTPPAGAGANKTWQERLPMIVAAAAVIVAIVAVALVLRKSDNNNVVAAGPSTNVTAVGSSTTIPLLVLPDGTETSTTTSSSTTTTTKPTTTVPVVIPPPPTVPPSTNPPTGTQAVIVDMSNMVNCPGCLASLRAQPSLLSQLTAQFPDKTALWGQCWTTGDTTHDDVGYTSNQWIYIVGPVSQGWVPIHLVGRQIYGLPACPQSTTQPPTTRATTTLPPSTTTTVATTTTTRTGP